MSKIVRPYSAKLKKPSLQNEGFLFGLFYRLVTKGYLKTSLRFSFAETSLRYVFR